MKNIKILDCTLRDGGYINDWQFGSKNIKSIITNLEEARINIIECGFIRRDNYNINSTVYSAMEQIKKVIHPKSKNSLYAIMIEHHNHVEDLIPINDGTGVDIIRITFRRKEWQDASVSVKNLIKKGYKVCVQPVGTVSYDDSSLLQLIKNVNELKPYAFYLVDTLGVMYQHEMRRLFYLIDNNLSKDICLGLHSHNNLQMSFSNAQEMIRMARQRDIIIDSSCYGMGRGVGNLATELLADYINNNIEHRYSLLPILNIIDTYLMPIYAVQRWGYDLPYFLSATAKCHPNYATYLMKKETLRIQTIEKILSLIPMEKRSEFDYKLIEKLYINMQKYKVDDRNAYVKLKEILGDRNVTILGPGSSIIKYKDDIKPKIKDTFVITANFVHPEYIVDALFISNNKRLSDLNVEEIKQIIVTSNLSNEIAGALVFNYSSLLGEGDACDNAGAMLIRILKNIGVKKLLIAGFDGFDVDSSINYAIDTYKKSLDYDTVNKKNIDISKQLKLALREIEYELITPTKYDI